MAPIRFDPPSSQQAISAGASGGGSVVGTAAGLGSVAIENHVRTRNWMYQVPGTPSQLSLMTPLEVATEVGKKNAIAAGVTAGLVEGMRASGEGASLVEATARGTSVGACVGGAAWGGAKAGIVATAWLAPESFGAAPAVGAAIGGTVGAVVGGVTCTQALDTVVDWFK